MKDSEATKRIIRAKILCFLSHSNRMKSENVQGSNESRTLHHHCNSRSGIQRATSKLTRNFYFCINKVKIFWLLMSLMILIWFWTRFLSQIFSRFSTERFSKWKLLLWWWILVALLFGYERGVALFGVNSSLMLSREQLYVWSVSVFLLYLLLVVIGIAWVFKQLHTKKIWFQIVSAFLVLILGMTVGKSVWGSNLVLYTFLLASAEEILKFSVGNNQSSTVKSKTPSALLFFSLLIAFSFSITENLLAIIVQVIYGESFTAGFLLWRGIVASLLHLIATGSIALVILKCEKLPLLIRYTFALLLGFLLHTGYNIALERWFWGITILLVLGALGILSYLMFSLDEIYEKQ